MLWITLALFIVGESVAQITVLRPCPAENLIETVKDFNLTAYMGRWFQNRKFLDLAEVGDKCVTVKYILGEKGSFQVKGKQISSKTGKETSFNGIAKRNGNSDGAKFTINYKISPGVSPQEDYWVIATDYNKWAATWNCKNSEPSRGIRNSVIYTRKRNPGYAVIEEVFEALLEKGLGGRGYYAETVQKNCSKSH